MKRLTIWMIAVTMGVMTLGVPVRAAVPPGLECLGGTPPLRPVTATCTAAGVVVDVHRGRGKTAQPVIVWMHGGAWSFGDRSQIEPVIRDQLERGWTVISVEYRVGYGALISEMVDDVRTVVRWTRASAAALNVDPDRIVLAGFSAGGHLAALAGLAPNQREQYLPEALRDVSGRPAAIISLSGVYDLRSWDVDMWVLGRSEDVLSRVLGCTTSTGALKPCPAPRLARFSPITRLGPSDAPILIVHGEADEIVPVDQALTMDLATRTIGVRTELAVVRDDHVVEIDLSHDRVEGFLDRVAVATE